MRTEEARYGQLHVPLLHPQQCNKTESREESPSISPEDGHSIPFRSRYPKASITFSMLSILITLALSFPDQPFGFLQRQQETHIILVFRKNGKKRPSRRRLLSPHHCILLKYLPMGAVDFRTLACYTKKKYEKISWCISVLHCKNTFSLVSSTVCIVTNQFRFGLQFTKHQHCSMSPLKTEERRHRKETNAEPQRNEPNEATTRAKMLRR